MPSVPSKVRQGIGAIIQGSGMTRGGARELRGKFYARARFGDNERVETRVPWAKSLEDALGVAAIIAELGDILAAGGRRDLVRGFAKEIATTNSAKQIEKIRKAVSAIVSGATKAGTGRDITFKQWAERYTSGELSKLHPDHVRVKDWSDDVSRLRLYVNPVVGGVPVHAFTVAHGDQVMAKLPDMTPANRRHVGQIVARLLHLAVYPGKLIPANPLPRGWLPKLDKTKRKHYSCLWPREESLLLAHAETPIAFRLFCGVLNREGMRLSELLDSDWWQWNLDEGTFTATKTKTGDPRMWAVRPDVARAMRAWRKMRPDTPSPFAEVLAWCSDRTHLAERFRNELKAAGVKRAELFDTTEHTGKLRAHDMRATFVTMSLAEGRTETWIRDRTAHKSTSMIDRYRRAARQVTELALGSLEDLDRALGFKGGGRGGDRRPRKATKLSKRRTRK